MLTETITRLLHTGDPASVIYRVKHKHGYYVWIEALARRVPSADPALPAEIVYSGRDISERVQIEQHWPTTSAGCAITDNLPALVAHVDKGERFTFANAQLATPWAGPSRYSVRSCRPFWAGESTTRSGRMCRLHCRVSK
jgi:PAS domain-containing protein